MRGLVTKRGNVIYLKIGSSVYQYDERQNPLGAGAMGVVFKGFECNTNTPVAIKRIIDRYANNPVIRSRAYQEADLMFRHPNLVEMLGCCEVQPNRVLANASLVVELTEAEKRICELFIPVLDALAYIHQKGIIHMDIKPSNIMMENGRNVRLMDLGIADVHNTINSTTSGMMGTPKYAAPEQFSDTDAPPKLTVATDIYEAGITLYELITTQNPFTAVTIAEAKEKHRDMVLPFVVGLSRPVYDVIRKATSINPEDRYQSAGAMKMDLMEAIRSKPTSPKWFYAVVALVFLLLVLMILMILMIS